MGACKASFDIRPQSLRKLLVLQLRFQEKNNGAHRSSKLALCTKSALLTWLYIFRIQNEKNQAAKNCSKPGDARTAYAPRCHRQTVHSSAFAGQQKPHNAHATAETNRCTCRWLLRRRQTDPQAHLLERLLRVGAAAEVRQVAAAAVGVGLRAVNKRTARVRQVASWVGPWGNSGEAEQQPRAFGQHAKQQCSVQSAPLHTRFFTRLAVAVEVGGVQVGVAVIHIAGQYASQLTRYYKYTITAQSARTWP